MALGDLRDSILGAVDFFTGSDETSHPSLGIPTINFIDDKNWRKSFPYSFKVIDTFNGNALASGFKEFNLQLNPQNLNQDEIFAVTMTPTQTGVVSEHNGIVFRDLQLSGTTGVHPRRGAGGANNKGQVILGPRKLRSGYKEFHELRNYFRAYAELKKQGKAQYQLVFNNYKDKEFLIVEPQKFSMKRAASRATLYDYAISLKAIGNVPPPPQGRIDFFDAFDDAIATAGDLIATGRGILLKSADILRGVERSIDEIIFGPLRTLDLALKDLRGLGTQIDHMGDNIVSKINASTTLQFLNIGKEAQKTAVRGGDESLNDIAIPANVGKAATKGGAALLALGSYALSRMDTDTVTLPENIQNEFNQVRTEASKFSIADTEDLLSNSTEIENKAAAVFNAGSPEYDEFIGVTTPSIDETKVTTAREYEILFGFSKVKEGLNILLSQGRPLTINEFEEELDEINEYFGDQLRLLTPTSTTEDTIASGTTLEQLAVKHLGDVNRWPEIVQLNNLKPPYITTGTSSTKGVLGEGDKILIPSTEGFIDTNSKTVRESRINEKANPTERAMGVDFLLNDANDLVMGANNDVLLATGGKNIKQAIRTKLSLRKGDLLQHPQIGVGLVVGEKTPTIDNVAEEIKNVILSDPRISEILSFAIAVSGSAINIKANLRVIDQNAPVPIDIEV